MMEERRRAAFISPMEINHSMGNIFVVKTKLMNEELSDKAEMAYVEKIPLTEIYNDSKNGRIIVNRNMDTETAFKYDYTGIYPTKEDAHIGAATVNRKEQQTVKRDMDNLMELMTKLEKLEKSYEEFRKVNLI